MRKDALYITIFVIAAGAFLFYWYAFRDNAFAKTVDAGSGIMESKEVTEVVEILDIIEKMEPIDTAFFSDERFTSLRDTSVIIAPGVPQSRIFQLIRP